MDAATWDALDSLARYWSLSRQGEVLELATRVDGVFTDLDYARRVLDGIFALFAAWQEPETRDDAFVEAQRDAASTECQMKAYGSVLASP